jgi:hypothetical protein
MDFITQLLSMFKPDLAKMNKELFKQGTGLQLDAIKPIIPGTIDDMLYDQLKVVVNKHIDNLGVKETGPLVVGDAEDTFDGTDVDAYLNTFSGVDPEVRSEMRRKPRLVGMMRKNFTAQEQARIVGNPFLLGLLSIFGPLVIEWIKNWLARN